MKKLFLLTFGVMILMFPISGMCQCVPESEVLQSWQEAVGQADTGTYSGNIVTTLECDPCKCPTGGMSSCYAYMAQKEHEKEVSRKKMDLLLDRALKFGICK